MIFRGFLYSDCLQCLYTNLFALFNMQIETECVFFSWIKFTSKQEIPLVNAYLVYFINIRHLSENGIYITDAKKKTNAVNYLKQNTIKNKL